MTTVQQVLVDHLHAFQSGPPFAMDDRLRRVRHDLNECSMSRQLNALSIKEDQNKRNDSTGTTGRVTSASRSTSSSAELSQQVSAALLRCSYCLLEGPASASSTSSAVVVDDALLDFMVSIAADYDQMDKLLDLAAQASVASSERVRVMACRWVGSCVKQQQLRMEPPATSSRSSTTTASTTTTTTTMTTAVRNLILPRLTDKAQAVRFAALQACATIANDDPIITEAILWNLHHDPSWANRCASLHSLPVHEHTVDHIIRRMRDVKTKVRLAAVAALHQISMLDLTADQCAIMVRTGLTDRCKETNDAMTVLLSTRWIKTAKYDPLVLLAHLKPSFYEQECEKVISTLLQVSVDSLKDLSDAEVRAFRQGMNTQPNMDVLQPEHILLSRLQCQHEKSPSKKSDMLQKIVPDIPMLCDAIHNCLADGIVENNQHETSIFCCNQLFKLVQIMDLQEEGSRRHFRAFCREILASATTSDDVLEEAIKAMSRAHDRQEDYLNSVAEILEPMTDPLRSVSIVTLVLENTSPRMAGHSALKGFVERVVPAVTNSDPLVREAGVGCVGRLALLSEESLVVTEFKPILLEIVANEQEKMEIRAQAMLAMSDLAMLFDTSILASMHLLGKDVNLVECVRDMLANENPAVVAIAAEIATKLLFSGKVQDTELVAALLVVFFNKSYEDYDEDGDVHEVGSVYRMQQLLSIFFPAFTMKGFKLVPAIGPMLDAAATKKRGRKPFPIAKMIEFVYSTAELGADETVKDKNKVVSETHEVEGIPKTNNALSVCLEISNFLIHSSDNLSTTNLRTLCKLLGGADVELDDSCTHDLIQLKEKVNELSMIITDEAALESLETMVELLEDVQEEKNNDDVDVEQDELAEAMGSIALEQENPAIVDKAGTKRTRGRQALGQVNY